MSGWEALVFGVVQGLTEYLPISSSAHLALLPSVLGTADPGLGFDVLLHAGTLGSTLVYFRREWWKLLAQDHRTLFWIGAATLPALLVGLLVRDLAATVFRGPGIMAVALASFGILLWWVDKRAVQRASLEGGNNGKTWMLLGLAQCLALVPGVSRSGITLIAGRALGYARPSAARLSFLLSAPVTLAALAYESYRWISQPTGLGPGLGALVVGGLAAFVSGLLAIDLLVRWLGHHGYAGFAVYRCLLALGVFLSL